MLVMLTLSIITNSVLWMRSAIQQEQLIEVAEVLDTVVATINKRK